MLIYFTPGEGKSERQGEAPLRSLMSATTGGVPHSIPEGCLKLAEVFQASAFGSIRELMGARVPLGRPDRERCPRRRRHPDRVPPRSRRPPGLFSALSNVPRAPDVMLARGAIGIFSQMWAPWCSRAPSATSRMTMPTSSSRSTALSRALEQRRNGGRPQHVGKLMK